MPDGDWSIAFRHPFERQAGLALLAAALDGQLDFVADAVLGNLGAQVGDAVDLRAVDGDDGLADDRRVGVAEVGCRQVAVIDLYDGEVRERISTDELARQAAAVGEGDDELARAADSATARAMASFLDLW